MYTLCCFFCDNTEQYQAMTGIVPKIIYLYNNIHPSISSLSTGTCSDYCRHCRGVISVGFTRSIIHNMFLTTPPSPPRSPKWPWLLRTYPHEFIILELGMAQYPYIRNLHIVMLKSIPLSPIVTVPRYYQT